jgi:serine/threonine protein kinase
MPSYYPGQVVNGYEILDCITSGAFASSYRARKGGKNYFLKEYIDPTEGSPEFRTFVGQQDDINKRLCSLKLRCLERLLDTFVTGYRYHQVKELLNCVDLAAYLPTDLDLDNRLFLCRLWLGILKELSSAGIVHQDLKPPQILMVKDSGVKLGHRMMFADFDWAILDGKMVRPVSTAGYATPEHLTGVTPTVASDLYQTGIVLYEILTGQLPFYRAGEIYDLAVTADRMKRGDFEPPAVVQPVVPTWASDIIATMLTWDMGLRPTVEDVIKAWDTKRPLAKPGDPPGAGAAPLAATHLCPASPGWIRLRHDNGANISFSREETPVNRQLFHGPFRGVITPAGHPVANYFPSDEVTPLFTVRREADGWRIAGGSHRNYGIFNGSPLSGSTWNAIRNGDRLELYSANEAGVVATFTFEVPT